MAAKTKVWDVTEHLDTPKAIAAYLEAAFEDGDPTLISAAIRDVARVRGIGHIAQETELSPESVSRVLSEEGITSFIRVLKILKALGATLETKPMEAEASIAPGDCHD